VFGTGSGVVAAKIMNVISRGKINPLIGSAGIASVPIAARVSHMVGNQKIRSYFDYACHGTKSGRGVCTAISGGILLALLGQSKVDGTAVADD